MNGNSERKDNEVSRTIIWRYTAKESAAGFSFSAYKERNRFLRVVRGREEGSEEKWDDTVSVNQFMIFGSFHNENERWT